VSKNDNNCHYHYTTTKVAVKIVRSNTWRGKPWGDLRKQTLGRGCDMLGQTVPVWAAAMGKARSSTVDSCVCTSCKTDIQ